MRPAIIEQVKQSKFICSACGSARDCNCNAPALERLAEKKEQDRQRAKAYRERKDEEKQQPRHVTDKEEAAPKRIFGAQDFVEHVLGLVKVMSIKERARFHAAYLACSHQPTISRSLRA